MEPGRALILGMRGDEVARLHVTLTTIGIDIDETEVSEQHFGPHTHEVIRRLQLMVGMEATGEVDETMLSLIEAGLERLQSEGAVATATREPHDDRLEVYGTVTDRDGLPMMGVTVAAFLCTLRDRRKVGDVETNHAGRYRMRFEADPDRPALVLEVHDRSEPPEVLTTSAPTTLTARRTHIDLPLDPDHRSPSEYDALAHAIAPLLGSLQPDELLEDEETHDLTFLAADTGIPKARIAFYSIAARLGASTGLNPRVFYALMREGVPPDAEAMALAAAELVVDIEANGQRLLAAMLIASDAARRGAVSAALARNLVPASYGQASAADLDELAQMASQDALTRPGVVGKTPIGQILDAASIPVDKQKTFVGLYSAATGSSRVFWQSLARNQAFTPADVATLRFTVDVGRFTRGHLPLISALITMRENKLIVGTRDLAKLTAAGWKQLIVDGIGGSGPIGIPKNFTVPPGQDQVDTYARLLERSFEAAHPTAAFTARLQDDKRSPFPAPVQLARFLNTNTTFSLRRSNVDAYLTTNPGAGVSAELRDGLLKGQRLLKVAPRYAAAAALLADGIHSSQHIYARGRDQFIATYKDHPALEGAAEAASIFSRAQQTYGLALQRAMQLNAQMTGPSPAAIGNPDPGQTQTALADNANLRTLFGSLDYCDCSDCRSVLSPAAYLVDLLHFLACRSSVKADPKTGKPNVKDILIQRRPDLVQTKLNCPNTNTALPYIDLVNELLEGAVDPPGATAPYQTTLTTDELNANPEHQNDAAYDTLLKTVYPWNLPFDLYLTETRTYLEQVGLDRVQLMGGFWNPLTITDDQRLQMAREALWMSKPEADIICGQGAANGAAYWGLLPSPQQSSAQDPYNGTVSGDWVAVLGHVGVLMQRAGITLTNLEQLLQTDFINPVNADSGRALRLQCDPPDSCDLSTMMIIGLTADALDRLHRFVRLMNRLGWDPYTLDTAITVLQGSVNPPGQQLNPLLLRELYAVTLACKRFGIQVTDALTLLGRIETRDVDPPGQTTPRYSLYHDLFQNLTVLGSDQTAQTALKDFTLNADQTELANPMLMLAGHEPVLLAALNLSEADLALAESTTDGTLTVANLSDLYAHILLAAGLGISMRELLALKGMLETELPVTPFYSSINPFDPAHPENLKRFCDAFDQISKSAFSVEQLDYLLRHNVDPQSGLAPNDVTTGTLLKSIRDGLIAFNPALVQQFLATILSKPDIDQLMAALADPTTVPVADQVTLLGKTGAVADSAAAQAALAALGSVQERYEYLLNVAPAQLQVKRTGLVVQQLAAALGLPVDATADLVTAWFPSRTDASKPMLDDFLALAGIARAANDSPIDRTEAAFAAHFDSYTFLDKAAKLITGLGLRLEEARWLRANGAGLGWLDPTKLPIAPSASAEGRFVAWSRLAKAVALKRSIPLAGEPFTSLMVTLPDDAARDAYLDKLLDTTHWSADALDALTGRGSAGNGILGLALADYASERAMTRIIAALALFKRLGKTGDAGNWIGDSVDPKQADAIKQAVKSKYSTDQWTPIAKSLRDPLREAQRDALVAYLLAQTPPAGVQQWLDPNDVFAYYLIDVEMGACQPTSRIVQAYCTVQLFVQRCILNLEPDVVVDAGTDGAWLQWQWMSRYRVWQANREVFLYPENWVEPALRTDKSQFFQELESDLLQKDVTQDSAEEAFLNYLEKLDAVARLEVIGTYYEANELHTILHVFARKQGDPPTIYYRQWIDSSHWSPWTKVPLDIVSDHVVPIVWNRRLYLFWATVKRKPDKKQPIVPVNPTAAIPAPPPPWIHLEVQLAWSELKGGKWIAKQTAPQTIPVTVLNDTPANLTNTVAGGGAQVSDIEPFFVTLKSSTEGALLHIDMFADITSDDGTLARGNLARFVLGGVGNAVEAYSTEKGSFENAGPETRDIGTLHDPLPGALSVPSASVYSNMSIVPAPSTTFNPDPNASDRPAVGPCTTSYSLYGALTSETMLDKANRYALMVPHQDINFDSTMPFFYQDGLRSYFVLPATYYQNGQYFTTVMPTSVYRPNYRTEYTLYPFYHPFVPLFIRELNRAGLDALFAPALQQNPTSITGAPAPFDFHGYYQPTDRVVRPYPDEAVDFDFNAGYADYNWELFFHALFEIAESLSTNRQFEQAKHWYEYIFNPNARTAEPPPQRFWVTKPFHDEGPDDYTKQQIANLLQEINRHDTIAEKEVEDWLAHPFDPHVIARWRPVAYQRAIVMKYIDNLLAWGDQLFMEDSMESVNLATQMYVLASDLLGRRPERVIRPSPADSKSYAELEAVGLDDFSEAVTAAENTLAPARVNSTVRDDAPALPLLPLYFCVPPNDRLWKYWDTVNDRLTKIRHCENIQGVFHPPALFAPPIDPGILVRAAAAGLDLSSVLSDLAAPLPPYRFMVTVREAIELGESVRAMGSELLGVLEKVDAEALALLRSGSEKKLQDQVRAMKQRAVDEANQAIDVLSTQRTNVANRQMWSAARKDQLANMWEAASLVSQGATIPMDQQAGQQGGLAATASLIPNFQFGGSGAGGSPHVTAVLGGSSIADGLRAGAEQFRVASAVLHTLSQMSAALGSYNQRKDERSLQYDTAGFELGTIDSQTAGAQIRLDIATKDQANHELVATLASDVDDFLHSKFTSQDLYTWMVGQTSATYFQAYQLAYAAAKRAEQCFQRELGLTDSTYIQFGYWDSLKKGLLAGDKLLYDLRRLQADYHTQHARELELTKHVSLLALDPYALVELRSTGRCTINLPELLFDLDNPGHYMRRLKSVGMTIPAVVGPYSSVSMKLTLQQNQIRLSPSQDASALVQDQGGIEAIVTSAGRDDRGLFELRLEDERYLPFEYAGAISTWDLRLNAAAWDPTLNGGQGGFDGYPQFDYNTISDVILHIQFTARDGGDGYRSAVVQTMAANLKTIALDLSHKGLYRLIDAKHDFSGAWYKFLNPGAGQDQVLTIDTSPDTFAFFTRGLDITITGIDAFGLFPDAGDFNLMMTTPAGASQTLTLQSNTGYGSLHYGSPHTAPSVNIGHSPATTQHNWTFKLQKAGAADFGSLTLDDVSDLLLVLRYEVKAAAP